MMPRILRLNISGQPVEWLNWEQATCLYARDMVAWTLGDMVRTIRGGISRASGRQSSINLHSIIACSGHVAWKPRPVPPLTNRALFRRDLHVCMYCGLKLQERELTRDHIVPRSRGGRDIWTNVVAACKRCNQRKGNRLPQEARMEMLAIPYQPNIAEWLALINGERIRGDQMEFLRTQFSANSRWD
jgi:5-methylcytosine-specific restriction endonuclease McrA